MSPISQNRKKLNSLLNFADPSGGVGGFSSWAVFQFPHLVHKHANSFLHIYPMLSTILGKALNLASQIMFLVPAYLLPSVVTFSISHFTSSRSGTVSIWEQMILEISLFPFHPRCLISVIIKEFYFRDKILIWSSLQ